MLPVTFLPKNVIPHTRAYTHTCARMRACVCIDKRYIKNEKTGKIDIYCKDLFAEVKLPRKNKEEALKTYVQKYAKLLEYYAIRYPYQWFNFFDFFSTKETTDKDKIKIDR